MKKTRRDIHKEIMYNKIMPTGHARKNIDEPDENEGGFGFYFHENSAENDEPETPEIPAASTEPLPEKTDEEKPSEAENESIVKILSEYKEYKDKKAVREKQQEIEAAEADSEENDAISEDSEDEEQSDEKVTENPETQEQKPEEKESPFPKLINIKEVMISHKIDEVLEKFNCCKCDSCKLEITAIALNRLTPLYTICHNEKEIEDAVPYAEYSKITSALINAIITIRANPVHK